MRMLCSEEGREASPCRRRPLWSDASLVPLLCCRGAPGSWRETCNAVWIVVTWSGAQAASATPREANKRR